MKNGSKNKILYVLTKPSKFNTPSFLIQNLELTMHSLLLSSSQSSIQKPSMTPYLCGCIYRWHFQSPLIPRTLHLFNPISHYRPSQIFNWKTQNPFTQNCYGSYIFLKKIATYYFCEFKRRIYETIWGEGDRVEREISKGFPHPKISSTVPILSTANFLSLYPPSLSPYLSIIHPPSSSNILSLSLTVCSLLLPEIPSITGYFELKSSLLKL